jgi:hypothetical protein
LRWASASCWSPAAGPARRPDRFGLKAFIRAKQVQFTETVPNGRLVEVESSHDIDLEKPELVLQEVQRILKTA